MDQEVLYKWTNRFLWVDLAFYFFAFIGYLAKILGSNLTVAYLIPREAIVTYIVAAFAFIALIPYLLLTINVADGKNVYYSRISAIIFLIFAFSLTRGFKFTLATKIDLALNLQYAIEAHRMLNGSLVALLGFGIAYFSNFDANSSFRMQLLVGGMAFASLIINGVLLTATYPNLVLEQTDTVIIPMGQTSLVSANPGPLYYLVFAPSVIIGLVFVFIYNTNIFFKRNTFTDLCKFIVTVSMVVASVDELIAVLTSKDKPVSSLEYSFSIWIIFFSLLLGIDILIATGHTSNIIISELNLSNYVYGLIKPELKANVQKTIGAILVLLSVGFIIVALTNPTYFSFLDYQNRSNWRGFALSIAGIPASLGYWLIEVNGERKKFIVTFILALFLGVILQSI